MWINFLAIGRNRFLAAQHSGYPRRSCYGIASHYLPNKTNQNTRTFVGSYNIHLIKNGEDWQIDEFKFNLKYIDGNPNLESS